MLGLGRTLQVYKVVFQKIYSAQLVLLAINQTSYLEVVPKYLNEGSAICFLYIMVQRCRFPPFSHRYVIDIYLSFANCILW